MNGHPEPEALSALLDGDVPAGERRVLDAHLESCGECRMIADALRATVADLHSFPAVEPTELERAAVQRALRQARSKQPRFYRRVVAVSSAAALVVAFAAIATNRNGAAKDGPAALALNAGPHLIQDARDFDETSARVLLGTAAVAGEAAAPSALEAPSGAGTGATTGDGGEPKSRARDAASDADFARCEDEIRRSARPAKRLTAAIAARYKHQPAFFLRYETTTHAELWVVRPADCYLLLFLQQRLR